MDSKFFLTISNRFRDKTGITAGTALLRGRGWVRRNGCDLIYGGRDGDIDYDQVAGLLEPDQSQGQVNVDMPANSIWHFVRRAVSGCGLESEDSPRCIVYIDANGDIKLAAPNAPVNVTIAPAAAGKFELRWMYFPAGQQIAPDGFRIYIDTGAGFDFIAADATVGHRGFESRWVSDSYEHGQRVKFIIRSYAEDGGESQNSDYKAATADSTGPAAITNLISAWEVSS